MLSSRCALFWTGASSKYFVFNSRQRYLVAAEEGILKLAGLLMVRNRVARRTKLLVGVAQLRLRDVVADHEHDCKKIKIK